MNESNVSGKLDQVAGKIKQELGEATGNQSLANQGAADQVKGNAKEAWGDVKDTASDVQSNARANASVENKQHGMAPSGHTVRDSIASAAEDVKAAVQNTLNGGKDGH